jgi:transcription antitermination factor NusA-like protein
MGELDELRVAVCAPPLDRRREARRLPRARRRARCVLAHALSPAKVSSAYLIPGDPDGRPHVRALVPDYQFSLAIGKEGQNVRLAADLTGAKIDIQPESILEGE